jgi:hypothetical protein
MAAVPMGVSLPHPHQPLQIEVLVGPTHVYDPAASMDQQALRLRLRG